MAKKPTTAATEAAAPAAQAPAEATPAVLPAVSEKSGKAKKNMKIQIVYLTKEQAETSDLSEARGVKIIMAGTEDVLMFSDMPENVLWCAAAFGLNTTLRNTHNSNENGGAGKDGKSATLSRIKALRDGIWATRGDGGDSGTPLVIEALIRAKQNAGQYFEGMEQKWLAQYAAQDKDGKAELTKKWLAFKPVEVAYLTIRAERAAAKVAAASQTLPDGADLDF